MNKKFGIVLFAAAALALAACGSSDDNGAPATAATGLTSDIPTSALANGAALNSYLNDQIAATSDTGEPIVVGDATTLPTDDTTETSL